MRDAPRSLLVLLSVLCLPVTAFAQGTTGAPSPPPTQDRQLRDQLGLGDAQGCLSLYGFDPSTGYDPGPDPDAPQDFGEYLLGLGSSIGNELRAICGPSAVTSASSLGGGMNTLQATKTATQFRLARRRIDQRLMPAGSTASPSAPSPPPGPPARAPGNAFTLFAPISAAGTSVVAADWGDDVDATGLGLFGEIRFDRRERVGTAYESAYDVDARSFTAGADYLNGRALVGGWFSRLTEDGSFTRFSPLIEDASGTTSRSVLTDPGVLSRVCGGLTTGGTLGSTTTAIGGFVGGGFGQASFADATFGWSRRANRYARNVCVIETGPTSGVTYENGVLRSDNGQTIVDDIYAGTLSGAHDVDELNASFRLGGNYGRDRWMIGPRGSFTLSRTVTDPYAETGKSTVANEVRSNGDQIVTRRTLGGPIGIEMAYDRQSYTSALLEGGAEVAVRAGRVVPFASGYWRHEFLDGYRLVTAHFVQDRRTTPKRFTFGHDRPDADSLLVGFGAAVAAGTRGFVRVEANTLLLDRLFSLFSFSASARVQF